MGGGVQNKATQQGEIEWKQEISAPLKMAHREMCSDVTVEIEDKPEKRESEINLMDIPRMTRKVLFSTGEQLRQRLLRLDLCLFDCDPFLF